METSGRPRKKHVKSQVLVVLGGIVLLAVAGATRREPPVLEAKERERTVRGESVRRTPHEVIPSARETEPVEDALEVRPLPEPGTTGALLLPRMPEAAGEDLRMLEAWILSLPPSQLRALDEAGQLNRHVARIVGALSRQGGDPDAATRELDDFLSRLNVHLGVMNP